MPYTNSEALNVFLSYASEDRAIADALARTLRAAFVNDVDVTTMIEFPMGTNWRRLIADSIDKTDIMVAIATGRLKPSHSFTGTEIGMFEFSRREKPNMSRYSRIERRMIPFAVLAKVPDPVREFEGIDIDPSALRDVRFDPASLAAKGSASGISDAGDLYKLLADIEDLVNDAKGLKKTTAVNRERIQILEQLATALRQEVFTIMRDREKDIQIPKSKLVVRLEPSSPKSRKAQIEQAALRIEGPCRDAFGFPDNEPRSLTWQEFIENADDEDIVYNWREALNSLISSVETNNFVNNNAVQSFDRKKLFRIFVSRKSTFYSEATEYDIYVVEMLRANDQGDPDTTTLLKAMEVGLGYRFMFLENNSGFSPQAFKAADVHRIKKRVGDMLTALNLILYTSEQYELTDPKTILRIMGLEVTDTIEESYEIWNREKSALYEAAKVILKLPEVTVAERKNFIAVLTSFCNHTMKMNRDYTAAVLGHLQARVLNDNGSAAKSRSKKGKTEARLRVA